MCGIFGIISKQDVSPLVVSKGLFSIKRRGPDDSRIANQQGKIFSLDYSNNYTKSSFPSINNSDEIQSCIGFNRLAIVNVNNEAMQPFIDENNRYIFAINGEIYNYKFLIEKFGLNTKFDSDSLVAFQLFLRLGTAFIHELEGMYAITIYDCKEKKLYAWRDRISMKPLYYYHNNGMLIFGSEIKSIIESGIVKKEINHTALAYSLYLGSSPAPLTLYEDIFQLPAGHSLIYDLNHDTLKVACYWHLQYNPSEHLDISQLNNQLNTIVKNHLIGDVKMAIALSGGIDSGALAYQLMQHAHTIKAYNLYHENDAYDERSLATINANNAKLSIDFITTSHLDKQTIDEWILNDEEPNTMLEPTYTVCQKAKQDGVKVLFSALGPDELFGGYNYFKQALKLQKAKPIIGLLEKIIPDARKKEILKELKTFGLENSGFILRPKPMLWSEIKKLYEKNNIAIPVHPLQYLRKQYLDIFKEFDSMPLLKKISWLDFYYYIASHHSIRTDKSSSYYGVEVRMPYLDHIFVQNSFNFPNSYNGIQVDNKPFFRKLVSDILPKEILNGKKYGFTIPNNNLTLNRNSAESMSEFNQWFQFSFIKIFGDKDIFSK